MRSGGAIFVGVFPAWFRPVVPVGFGMGLQVAPGGAPLESSHRRDFGPGTNASGVWMGCANPLVRWSACSGAARCKALGMNLWPGSSRRPGPSRTERPELVRGVAKFVLVCVGVAVLVSLRSLAGKQDFFTLVCEISGRRCGRSGKKNSPCVHFCGRCLSGEKKSGKNNWHGQT